MFYWEIFRTWTVENVPLTSIERNRHTPRSDVSNRYYREMKSAGRFSVDRKPQGEGGGGELSRERSGDARRLALGCKVRILVLLGVVWAKRHYI